MKILFVVPGGDVIYGSGRSVVQLARALDLKFDLLVGKSLLYKVDEEQIRESFGSNLEQIYQLWLPNVNFYYGKSKNIFIKAAAAHYVAYGKTGVPADHTKESLCRHPSKFHDFSAYGAAAV